MEVNKRRNKLPHRVIVKAPGLLPMLYKPGEICGELEIADSTLRDWFQTEAPHQRDERGRIWVNGQAFARWVQQHGKPKTAHKLLNEGEAFCFHCKRVSRLLDPRVEAVRGKLVVFKGTCEFCGGSINRGARRDRAQ